MKKIFSCAAILAALAFASCKSNTPACWEVTIVEHIEMMGEKHDATTTQLMYGTESEIDAAIKQLTSTQMSMPGASVTFDVTKKKADKSESDCVGTDIKF